jgi:phosphorylase kinase alpha/beta subunit
VLTHDDRPRTSNELLQNIVDVCSGDHSAVSLTQEILVYLAMFIRAEPDLFTEMLRLRIGLIQNVMISELSRAMSCSRKF